jgi:two-component system chemotaxis response regulator CheB
MDTLSMVKVLVVEDSITTRRFLCDLVETMPGMMVCGEAHNGIEAVRLARELRPHVISMDIQMPEMDGLEATREIMTSHPTPIVVVSGLGQKQIDFAMLAMEAGALAAVETPTAAPQDEAKRHEFLRMLRLMAGVSVVRRSPLHMATPVPELVKATSNAGKSPQIVVVGASAGGPGAIARILEHLPERFPLPIIIVQHLGPDFVPGFATWLSRRSPLPVRLAVEGGLPLKGEVTIAPGGKHLTIGADGRFVLHSEKGDYRHQPSINKLFESVAEVYGGRAIAILLSGMGDDGADGMAVLATKGAHTLAQDEATSVVFGIPAAAIAREAVQYVLPVQDIAAALLNLVDYRPVS